jgi:hypothetical protein
MNPIIKEFGLMASNWQNTSSPKYNDYISLLILQCLIPGLLQTENGNGKLPFVFCKRKTENEWWANYKR